MGFTPQLVAGVWTGNNNNDPMKVDAVLTAGPIWKNFMQEALKGQPVETFTEPEGIKHVTVDRVSGKLPTEFTAETKTEVFADYAVPTTYDDVHVAVKVDSLTGEAATELTPPEQVATQTYTVFHSERRDNPNWENAVIGWALAAGFAYPPNGGQFVSPGSSPGSGDKNVSVDIIEPQDNDVIIRLPFEISVAASSPSGIARLDLSIDGQQVQSIISTPYAFSVSKKYSDGPHTIAVHAVDRAGKTADTSTNVTFSLDQANKISLVDPAANSLLTFPNTLKAASLTNFDAVEFYYQTGSTIKLIGAADTKNQNGSQYEYSLIWAAPPKAGSYKIFARTANGIVSSGITSSKVTVTIP
jgi:hypothetical protein